MPHRVHRRLRLRHNPLKDAEEAESAMYNGYVIKVARRGPVKSFVYNRRPPEVLLKVLEIWRESQSPLPLQEFIELALGDVDPDDI